jgi:hypothetical protein
VPGCSLMIDGLGTDYALSNGRNPQTDAGSSPAVKAAWLSAFRAATYAWLTSVSFRRIPWTPQLKAYFNSHFVPLTEGPDRLYIRAGRRSRTYLCPGILAVITRQTILIGGLQIEKISTATTARWHAFELLGARISIRLEQTLTTPPET